MLARLQKSMKEKDQGFTLIELLVVIVIIGILAAIAIPIFLNQRKKGVDASLKSDLKSAALSVETLITDKPNATETELKAVLSTAATFVPSSGNTIGLTGDAISGYCITGSNPGSTKGQATPIVPANQFFYSSTKGGLQASTATAC